MATKEIRKAAGRSRVEKNAGSTSTPRPSRSLSEVIRRIESGFPYQEIVDLADALDLPANQVADILGISKATLARRKNEGQLTSLESDRVNRYTRILRQAVEVFESLPIARQWLKAPAIALGGVTPLEFARTEVGAREVEDLLGRIDYGVYS